MTLAKEWKDGVLAIIMRNMSKEWAPFGLHQNHKWVILDGDIDAVWIESMNTVMDDNKVSVTTPFSWVAAQYFRLGFAGYFLHIFGLHCFSTPCRLDGGGDNGHR